MIDAFRADGKKLTLASLHAALGNRGSMSTLIRLKSEIEAEALQPKDSLEALHTFREVWAAAVEEGRKQQECVLVELRETLKTLTMENERLEGVTAAAEHRFGELQTAKSAAELDSHRVRAEADAEVSRTKSALADSLQKLAESQAAQATELATLQAQLAEAVQKAHAWEIELVRSQALLEAKGVQGTARAL